MLFCGLNQVPLLLQLRHNLTQSLPPRESLTTFSHSGFSERIQGSSPRRLISFLNTNSHLGRTIPRQRLSPTPAFHLFGLIPQYKSLHPALLVSHTADPGGLGTTASFLWCLWQPRGPTPRHLTCLWRQPDLWGWPGRSSWSQGPPMEPPCTSFPALAPTHPSR